MCSASSGNSSESSSKSGSESDEHEEGEIEDNEKMKPQRKSRVDPKEIPEVSNKYLMRSAPPKDDATKESDSDDKAAKHGKSDRSRKDSDSRGRNDSKGYASCSHQSFDHIFLNWIFLLDLAGRKERCRFHEAVVSSKEEVFS